MELLVDPHGAVESGRPTISRAGHQGRDYRSLVSLFVVSLRVLRPLGHGGVRTFSSLQRVGERLRAGFPAGRYDGWAFFFRSLLVHAAIFDAVH